MSEPAVSEEEIADAVRWAEMTRAEMGIDLKRPIHFNVARVLLSLAAERDALRAELNKAQSHLAAAISTAKFWHEQKARVEETLRLVVEVVP